MAETSKMTLDEFEEMVQSCQPDEIVELTREQGLSLLRDIEKLLREQ